MDKITGIFIDPRNSIAKAVTIGKSLDDYYKLLDCDTIDIVSRKIGKERVDIICDDEALLKDSPVPSAIDRAGRPMLFNSILIVKFDGVDDLMSLAQPTIEQLLNEHIGAILTPDMRFIPVVTDMDY